MSSARVFPARSADDANRDAIRAVNDSLSEMTLRAGPTSTEFACLGLFLVRESDEWDMEMFNAMREQTYQEHRHIPAIEAIRKVGLAPLQGQSFEVEWEQYGKSVIRDVWVEPLNVNGKTLGHLFYFEGYWHLWSQSSAAKVSALGFNDFTTGLIEVVQRLRPERMYVANLSRIIRSEFEARRLSVALTGNVGTIHAKSQEFVLHGPGSTNGFMMLSMLGWCAAMERDAIVQRLLTGKIAKWRRSEWPFGETQVPFGFKLNSQKQLVPDLKKVDQVAEMMKILISNAPASEMARQLDRVGVHSMRRNRKTDKHTPFSAMENPTQALRSLYAMAPLWCTGEYLYRYSNTLPGFDELSGVPIVRYPGAGKDPGELQMLYKVQGPKGGWADQALLDAFAATSAAISTYLVSNKGWTPSRPLAETVRESSGAPAALEGILSSENMGRRDKIQRNRRGAARSTRAIAPFVGRNWVDDGWFYEIQVAGTNIYRIVRWPFEALDPDADAEILESLGLEATGRKDGRRLKSNITAGSADRQIIAYIRKDEFSHGFVDATIKALTEQIPANLRPGQKTYKGIGIEVTVDLREQAIRRFEKEAAAAEADALGAARLAVREKDEEQADAFNEMSKQARARARKARAEIEDLRIRPTAVVPDKQFDALSDVWLPALASLKTENGRILQAHKNALDQVAVRMRMDRRGGYWWVSVFLRVHTANDAVAELGPIEWQARGTGRGNQVLHLNRKGRPPVLGGTRAALFADLTRGERMTFDAARTAMNSPFPELPLVLINALHGDPLPAFVSEQWREPKFVAWLLEVYTDPDWWWVGNGRYFEFNPLRQYVTSVVARLGRCSDRDFRDVSRTRSQMVRLTQTCLGGGVRTNGRSVRDWHPAVALDGEVHPSRPVFFVPVQCDCGLWADIVARVPEVRRDLLCSCGRMPDAAATGLDPQVRFPDEYQLLKVSEEDCLAELRHFRRKHRANMPRLAKLVFGQRDLLESGVTQAVLSRAAGTKNLSGTLKMLEMHGLLTSVGARRGAIWTITDDGRAHIAEHEALERETTEA